MIKKQKIEKQIESIVAPKEDKPELFVISEEKSNEESLPVQLIYESSSEDEQEL